MRLIDADEIRKKAVPHTRGDFGYSADIRKWAVLVGDIDDAATIEAEPVKHGQWGEWTYAYNEVMYQRPCSECGRLSVEQGMYCTHCGAKMFDVR